MVLLPASPAEVKGIEAHALRPTRCELLGVESDKPLTGRLKGRERSPRAGKELVQLESEEGSA